MNAKSKALKKKKVEKVMHEFKEGELHSGSKHGPEVKSRSQAVAIALSEARKGRKHHKGTEYLPVHEIHKGEKKDE